MDAVTASRVKHIGIAGVLAVVVIGGALRLSPWCMANAGPFGWKTWTRVFPNLACSLDLSALAGIVSAEEIEARLESFTNLRSLDLSKLGLKTIPNAVFSMSDIETLTLEDNELTGVDAAVADLKKLKHLNIAGNGIRSLPGSLGTISGLQTIDASDNELTSLPDELGDSDSLRSIDLSKNALDPQDEDEIGDSLPNVSVTFDGSSSSSSSTTASTASQGSVKSTAGSSSTAASASSTAAASSAPGSSSSTSAQQSSIASSSTGGSTASSAASSSSSPEGIPDPGCTPNFTMNGYSFCIPDDWTVNGGDFRNAEGTLVAHITCPLTQADYRDWTLQTRSRTYMRPDGKHGADLWEGTPKKAGDQPVLLVFMHRHEFASWFGENYGDVAESCQVQGLDPDAQENIFRLLYLSVY